MDNFVVGCFVGMAIATVIMAIVSIVNHLESIDTKPKKNDPKPVVAKGVVLGHYCAHCKHYRGAGTICAKVIECPSYESTRMNRKDGCNA